MPFKRVAVNSFHEKLTYNSLSCASHSAQTELCNEADQAEYVLFAWQRWGFRHLTQHMC